MACRLRDVAGGVGLRAALAKLCQEAPVEIKGYSLGNASAPVTVEEWGDYQ